MQLPDNCMACGVPLAGSWTKHKRDCPFLPLTVEGMNMGTVEKMPIRRQPPMLNHAMAQERLAERRATRPEKIDNASLPADSPMYYYCDSCGQLADVKPEDWFMELPKKLCDFCQYLKDVGWLDASASLEVTAGDEAGFQHRITGYLAEATLLVWQLQQTVSVCFTPEEVAAARLLADRTALVVAELERWELWRKDEKGG